MSKMSKTFRTILLIGILQSFACLEQKNTDASEIEHKVNILLAKMTLDEKIGQMTQARHFSDITTGDITKKHIGSIIHTEGVLPGKNAADWQAKFRMLQEEALSTRLGIPLLFGVDAVHGQNTYNGATIFPHNIGLGATHNPALVKRAAEITAIETQACGFNWVFSPCVSIPLNEKWGRFYEAYSEDSALTNSLTKAAINGLQGNLSSKTTVMATAKHYIGDGATDDGKEGGITTLSSLEINKLLLAPYKTAVREDVGAIMASFNTIDSLPMHAHRAWITDTLKNKLQFNGIVISDWKGYSKFGQEDIINAGVDMVMAVDGDLDFFQSDLKKAVENGTVSQDRIDNAVRRILRQKYKLGLFENPFPDTTLTKNIGTTEHRAVARKAVRESLVLLKNEDILPLNKNTRKIIVVGEHANNSGLQSGGWTIHWQGTETSYLGSTTILQGIKNQSDGQVIYDSLGTTIHADADVAILVVGETPYAEFFGDIGNGTGKHKLTLSQKHQEYISNYTDQNINVVVVLVSGRPLLVTEELEKSTAFVAAWLPGSEGAGVAEVLFGKYDFHGKLPHSWPKSIHDFNGKYGPNYWNDSITPLFPLGYGLTYRSTDNCKK
jgi:beta-glucosidase